jgi:hypothetical protein
MALATQAQCAEPANVFLKSDHLKKDRRGRRFTFPLKKTTCDGGKTKSTLVSPLWRYMEEKLY